jgi:hypothetical protein
MGMPNEFFEKSVAASTVHGSDKGLFRTLLGLVGGDAELRREYNHLRQMILSRPALKPLAREIMPLANRYCLERHWLARYQELRSLMGSWRFLHRWFAIVLLGAVLFHILIAFQMGHLDLLAKLKAFYHHFP